MQHRSAKIETSDGLCPATLVRPDGDQALPGVIVVMDAIGIRPAIMAIAERLASFGYCALLPDLFYRAGPYEPTDPKVILGDVEKRNAWMSRYYEPFSPALFLRDLPAYIGFLDRQTDVAKGKLAVTGYCMGGGMALKAAAAFPDRVALAASFHGGRLATDAPDSPHRGAPQMRGYVYVAGAVEDQSFPDEQKERLEQALTAAHVPHKIETYAGAKHGWVPSDMPTHNPEAAERHYAALRTLLADNLGVAPG